MTTDRSQTHGGSLRAAPRPPLDFPATLPAFLERSTRLYRHSPCVIEATRTTTYGEVEHSSRLLARRMLAAAVGKGTRVGMMFPQTAEWVTTFFAAGRIGALVMPFSTFYAPAELRRALRHGDVQYLILPRTMFGRDMVDFLERAIPELAEAESGPLFVRELPYLRAIFVDGEPARSWVTRTDESELPPGVDDELLANIEAEVAPCDEVVSIFTSGTTTEPKAVVLTHGTQVRHAVNLAELRDAYLDSKVFALMPFFWIGGLNSTMLTCMYAGSAMVCQERFEPGGALDLIERERPTSLRAWPNVAERMKSHPSFAARDLAGISYLSSALVSPLRHNSLGMTETCGPHSSGGGADRGRTLAEEHRGSFGPCVPYVQRKVVDTVTGADLPDGEHGEICIRGYSVMSGMYKVEREEVFDADGWYHTGDFGSIRDGFVFFTGRGTSMIKTGGSNVSPREVEAAIEVLPNVAAAFVVGIDDPHRMQIVAAALVPKPGAAIALDAVRAALEGEISNYKIPRRMIVLAADDVPMLASGKVDLRKIEEIFATTDDLTSVTS